MYDVNKIRGGIYGLAVGDALGATVEFMSKAEIKARYGVLQDIIGGGWLNLRPGDWTDDTEMALAVAEGIIQDPVEPVEHIGEAFLRWRATNPPDIGSTIRAVFNTWDRLKDWHRAAEQIHMYSGKTAGNGALMRTLPLAFVYRDAADLYIRCMEIARMTHWDPEAGLTCYLYCLTARGLLAGLEFAKAYDDALAILRKVVPPGEIGDAAKKLADRLERVASWPEQALRPTTVGAVTGGLAGIMYGYEEIPARWATTFSDGQQEQPEAAVAGLVRLVPESAKSRGG